MHILCIPHSMEFATFPFAHTHALSWMPNNTFMANRVNGEKTLSTWMNRSICVVEIMNYLNHNITYDCLKIITAKNGRKEIKKKEKTIPRTKRFLEMDMLIAYGRLNFIENVSKWLFINSQLWMCRLMPPPRTLWVRKKQRWNGGEELKCRQRHRRTE